MSLSISIPLSGYYASIKGLYVERPNTIVIEDVDPSYRLLGYVSGGFRIANDINSYIPERVHLNIIDIPIPIHKKSLVSANLSFIIYSGINPPASLIPTDQSYVPDFRDDLISDFGGSFNFPVELSVQSGSYSSVSSLYEASVSTKSSAFKGFFNPNQTYSIPITNQLAYQSNQDSWTKNSNSVFFISGIPSGAGAGGVIDLSSLYLNIVYNPVPPFAAAAPIALETDYKQITLNWLPPSDNGDANITEYNLQYGIYSGVTYIDKWYEAGISNTTSFILENLELDSSYVFKVAAKNSAGLGEYSPYSNPVTISRSSAPITSLNFNDANYTRIRLRRANLSQWSGVNPTLALGEAGYELDTKKLKIGNGIDRWNSLDYLRVDNSSISFPKPPDVNLIIGSSRSNSANNDRIILNLSSGNRFNIVGEDGIKVSYSDSYQRIIITTDKLYNPINSGTIFNPTNSGTPGSLLYDLDWFYFCVRENYWQRTPIDKTWFDMAGLAVSNTGGAYASNTSIIFDKKLFSFNTDGDPYPALAGRPLVNDGITPRVGFGQNSTIRDQNHSFLLIFRGGENSHNPMRIDHTGVHGVMNNGVLVKSISAGSGALPGFIPAPRGFTYNAIANDRFFGVDDCGGSPDLNGVYTYRNGNFLKTCWNTSKFYSANNYYSETNYSGDHFRHPDGHSKILGFCLDGYPIYGPYSYSVPIDKTSPVSRMTSSYVELPTDSHRPTDWKYWNTITVTDTRYSLPVGTFLEDYVYVENHGLLDQFNGRFGVTPEFPSGTYAYYLTFKDDLLSIPAYPYIFGTGTKQHRALYSV
jgi:hypothetical protein